MRRHHWELTVLQKENLHQYLAQVPVLQALYFAKQQLNGFLVLKSLKAERAQKNVAQIPGVDPAVRAKSGQGAGRDVTIVGTDRTDVAFHQVQRDRRGMSYEDGDVLAPCSKILRITA